jgi:hypothetical protein
MNVTSPRADVTATFRDANQPRPLAARLIAAAHRHPRGWTLSLAAGGRCEFMTFDAVADAVTQATGVSKLLIVWPGRDDAQTPGTAGYRIH